jgi:hypothetical protein
MTSLTPREILLRLEKYHYRINFAKGILQSRNVTYDRSMRKLAKPLPMDTPSTIELAPGNTIRVTLIDANHCVGAVMFLIEGNGKAILYTGDIRAETWWVNSIVQNPVLLPYTFGNRRLDCIYLDTTFATKRRSYEKFPSKAEGIQELLDKVSQYPEDTVFYFHSWTFGYENVWIALSAFLGSRIHLDDYRSRIYGSLSTLEKRELKQVGLNAESNNKALREHGLEVHEANALCGFRNGNHIHPGCLTSRESVRIHSCERGMGCRVMDHDTEATAVHIVPIITRANGAEIHELGAGGGKGDLDQKEEINTGGAADLSKLIEICAKTIKDERLLTKVLAPLQQMLARGDESLDLGTQLQKANISSQDSIPLQTLISILSATASRSTATAEPRNRTIRFPYSRHSSYSELCELVAILRPMDIFPCTVDELNWVPDLSMHSLFGEYCSASIFRHDVEMSRLHEARIQRRKEQRSREETPEGTQGTNEHLFTSPASVSHPRSYADNLEGAVSIEMSESARHEAINIHGTRVQHDTLSPVLSGEPNSQQCRSKDLVLTSDKDGNRLALSLKPVAEEQYKVLPASAVPRNGLPVPPPVSDILKVKNKGRKLTNRQLAYEAAIGTQLTWSDYGGLSSTRTRKEREEEEL